MRISVHELKHLIKEMIEQDVGEFFKMNVKELAMHLIEHAGYSSTSKMYTDKPSIKWDAKKITFRSIGVLVIPFTLMYPGREKGVNRMGYIAHVAAAGGGKSLAVSIKRSGDNEEHARGSINIVPKDQSNIAGMAEGILVGITRLVHDELSKPVYGIVKSV